MKEFFENGYQVFREGKNIIVKSNDIDKMDFELIQESVTLGKLNLPLSNNCTMQCLYCSEAEYIREHKGLLDEKSVFQVIDAYFEWIKRYSTLETVRLSFDYGGEPVCQLELLEKVSSYFRNKCKEQKKLSSVLMTTNCAWDNELLPRVIACVDEIIVSIDGPKGIYEKYRKYKVKKMTFDLILNNALEIYRKGKLKHFSSVVTYNTIENSKEYIEFFMKYFPGSSIKTAAVIVTGDASTNGIERIALNDWANFVKYIKDTSDGKITIIDSKPEKKIDYFYRFGCEHMRMTNWFCWLNGYISCCTDRDNLKYYFASLENGVLNLDTKKMEEFIYNNDVNSLQKCKDCLAKYYCAGGCPDFRDGKLNCERRVEKYARMFIEKAKTK